MKASINQKIRTGIFTVAGILLLIAGIFFIGAKQNMFDDSFLIYGTFKSVGGIEEGNNIRFAGINSGTVERIKMLSDTMIRIDMRMKEKVRPFLKADAMAVIGSDGLMGDKMIIIAPGSAGESRLLSDGSRIITSEPVDFDKVISKLTKVADNAEIITGELAAMALQIRGGKGSIGRLLYSDNLSKSIEGTLDNTRKMTGSLAGIALQVQSGKGSVGSLMYTDSLSKGLESTVAKANVAMHTADGAMLTIQEAAYGFSENMKALQGNFFLRGYFKKKAEEDKKNGVVRTAAAPEGIDADMDEKELADIIAEAQKALDAKRLKK
ncbi:phospholipid/cholesterol/gamma-HCH transport system substrate-binding protein [Arcticibacter tournemirensis]|uniref:MCE family protein n=1 Tax=Arcticibacter tournemirensis TaxID=699437 RepID=A0A4Q0M8H1_9SPHI|nr:MlaD family protein [Arcticibacter tournemirensis]KAA8486818.1 MCE family protein [Arcticibacter tournemirensis]RXF69394.1 MCE family protein [Arcticibacter tournemirensis]TQM49364.1 phospholipid/cholesterol/gamma-HCH transport system substrate-binding protein [Arcticibacter tournemirensis]